LNYNIHFTNDSEIPLRDAIVSLQLESEVLDFEELQLKEKGDYDSKNKKITWKASDVPALKTLRPKDSGTVSFSVPVLKKLPIESPDDYNFSISTLALIDSEDIPEALRENKTVLSNMLTVPVGAKVILSSQIKSEDAEGGMLKVGKKSTYEIIFSVDSINNDISDALVTMSLPTYINYESGDKEFEHNERTNEITWEIGDVAHGAGITSEQEKGKISVSIVPSIEQAGESPVFVKEQILTAKDVFTEMELRETGAEVQVREDVSE
ncbi:MAG: hypothetical protein ABFQ53_02015, partial [Patescibacteria group bacterium]